MIVLDGRVQGVPAVLPGREHVLVDIGHAVRLKELLDFGENL